MHESPQNSFLTWLNKPWIVWLLLFGLLVGISATGYRTYRQYSMPSGEFDWTNRGHSDFHNGAYFPSLAFREGVNPYSTDAKDRYLLTRSSPIYSPVVFIWHLPFSLVGLYEADIAFFIFNVAMLGLLAWMGIRMSGHRFSWGIWLMLFAFLVYSRPGHVTLFTGYFTTELVIGTIVALHFAATRPFVSGCGMLLASGKPTYILPLIVLMLCRRNYRAVVMGIALCTAGGLIGLGWLASFSSPMEVIAGINEGRMALHDDPTEDPINTWTRLDTVGTVSKVMGWKPDDIVYLISMLIMLAIPGWVIFKASAHEQNRGATGLTATIACLAILVSIYHHSYDSLLIVVPWIGIAFFNSIDSSETPGWMRKALSVLMAVPLANYLSTRMFQQKTGLDPQGWVWEILTSANGACLLVALGLLVWSATQISAGKTPVSD
jgi:hypothetical protein